MKPFPFAKEDWKQAWKVLPRWGVLHRVAAIDEVIDPEDYGGPVHIIGATCCGREGVLRMPGVLSRLGLPRCKQCCRIVGVPEGNGMPGNHDIEEPS